MTQSTAGIDAHSKDTEKAKAESNIGPVKETATIREWIDYAKDLGYEVRLPKRVVGEIIEWFASEDERHKAYADMRKMNAEKFKVLSDEEQVFEYYMLFYTNTQMKRRGATSVKEVDLDEVIQRKVPAINCAIKNFSGASGTGLILGENAIANLYLLYRDLSGDLSAKPVVAKATEFITIETDRCYQFVRVTTQEGIDEIANISLVSDFSKTQIAESIIRFEKGVNGVGGILYVTGQPLTKSFIEKILNKER